MVQKQAENYQKMATELESKHKDLHAELQALRTQYQTLALVVKTPKQTEAPSVSTPNGSAKRSREEHPITEPLVAGEPVSEDKESTELSLPSSKRLRVEAAPFIPSSDVVVEPIVEVAPLPEPVVIEIKSEPLPTIPEVESGEEAEVLEPEQIQEDVLEEDAGMDVLEEYDEAEMEDAPEEYDEKEEGQEEEDHYEQTDEDIDALIAGEGWSLYN